MVSLTPFPGSRKYQSTACFIPIEGKLQQAYRREGDKGKPLTFHSGILSAITFPDHPTFIRKTRKMTEDNDSQARADVRERNNQAHERIIEAIRSRFTETGEVLFPANDIQKSIPGMTVGVFQRVIAARPSTIKIERDRNGHGHHAYTFIGPHSDLLRQWRGKL